MRKKSLLLIASVVVLTVLLVLMVQVGEKPAMASNLGSMQMEQESTYTVMLPAIFRYHSPSYVSPFGIVMYGRVDDDSGLQVMEEAGIKRATTILHWVAIQPNRGDSPNWSSFDAKAQNAQAAGMDLFVLFTSNPSWAATYPGGPVTNMQDLVDFVTLMAERYDCDGTDDAPGHPCVRYWSFYAEPDNGDLGYAQHGKGYWGHNGAGYAAMLKAISPAIHAADPEAKVLIGGLAYDWFEPSGPYVRSFLADTLAALNTYPGGAKAYLDGVAFHYYPVSPDLWPSIREKGEEIRGIMANHGVGDLPLLCPEMGYWSSPCHGSSEMKQAYWLTQTSVRGMAADIGLLSYYKVFDDAVACGPEDSYPDRTSGLLYRTGAVKPAYAAYQTLTRELALARYAGPFQPAGVEGYVFAMPTGRQKTVLWSRAGTVRVVFPSTHLRVVSATGDQVYDIRDNQHQGGAPGDVDGGIIGQIQLAIAENQPFYVEPK